LKAPLKPPSGHPPQKQESRSPRIAPPPVHTPRAASQASQALQAKAAAPMKISPVERGRIPPPPVRPGPSPRAFPSKLAAGGPAAQPKADAGRPGVIQLKCKECNKAKGHAATCSRYQAPEEKKRAPIPDAKLAARLAGTHNPKPGAAGTPAARRGKWAIDNEAKREARRIGGDYRDLRKPR
jgi:hypothetical protein